MGRSHVPKDETAGKKTGLAEERELWLELLKTRRVYALWKKGQATQEDYKDIRQLCREKIRRAKAQLELSLATAIRDNKKCFYKYISNKMRVKENFHPLLDAGGKVVTMDVKRQRYLMPSLPQFLIVTPVVLRVPSPLSWKTGTRSRMKAP